MNSSVDARIEKIKGEHLELLKMVREKILKHKDNFKDEMDLVITLLNYDEESVKKYQAMIQAQELITTLTQQVVEAKTAEEVANIRKRLNYYINKIKGELKKREVSQDVVDSYQEQATSLRKDIASYIRFLKREDNIVEIDQLYSNYDKLSLEEMDRLKKCLRKENQYNSRNLKASMQTTIQEEKEEVKDSKVGDVSFVEIQETVPEFSDEDFVPSYEDASFGDDSSLRESLEESFRKQETHGLVDFIGIDETEFKDVHDYLYKRSKSFSQQYGVQRTYDYHRGSIGKNIVNFFRNLPRYIHNKKAIRNMERDYFVFYRGNDLASYMEYMKRRNSIKQGLRCIFDRSYLYSKDAMYLNQHRKCSRWLFDFCQEHSMDLPILSEHAL